MFNLTVATDLEKAGHSIGGYFAREAEALGKSVTSHEEQATHHSGLANLHKAHAADHQAAHDALDNAHELKAHMAKGAAFHTSASEKHDSLHKVHSAEAEKCKASINSLKALASEWGATPGGPVSSLFTRAAGSGAAPTPAPTGNVINDMVQETTVNLAKKSMELMDNDPEVKQYMRETIMKMIGETIGNTVVPTHVSGVAPAAPGITAVPRAGAPAALPVANVPLEFQKVFAIDDDGGE